MVRNGSLCIRLNEEDSGYFKTGKGLRQGNPLSPLLFNLVGDVFSRMLMKAADHGLISGLLLELFEGGIIGLQYADDKLLFLGTNLEKAKNFKWILTCFEHMSRMKINYEKSDLMCVGLEDNEKNDFARFFCCETREFPFTYLGVPLHYRKLKRENIQLVVDKIIKRQDGGGSCYHTGEGDLTQVMLSKYSHLPPLSH